MEAESLNQEKPKSPDGKKEKKKMHKVDHLTEIIGVFGRFHGLVYTIIGITISMHAWQMMSNKFFTRKTESWCARPDSLSGIPIDLWLNLSAPIKNNESGEFDRCRIFNVDYLNLNRRPSENTPTIPCEAWEYADRPFDVSLTTCSISRVFYISGFTCRIRSSRGGIWCAVISITSQDTSRSLFSSETWWVCS